MDSQDTSQEIVQIKAKAKAKAKEKRARKAHRCGKAEAKGKEKTVGGVGKRDIYKGIAPRGREKAKGMGTGHGEGL